MNSLVVFVSVMALAAAAPSYLHSPGVITYGVPTLALGSSAVSQQSRIDIKSSPAVVSETVSAPVLRTVVSGPSAIVPTAYASPIAFGGAAVSHQSRVDIKSSPAVVSESISVPEVRTVVAGPAAVIPTAYAATVGVAPAAVSHQSRVDIKSSPAIVSETISAPEVRTVGVVAEPAAVIRSAYAGPVAVGAAAVSHQSRVDIKSSPGLISTVASGPIFSAYSAGPFAYSAPYGPAFAPSVIASIPSVSRTVITPYDLSAKVVTSELKEGESSQSLPAETPEVAAARAAHEEAKAQIEAEHSIKKRSVGLVATPAVTTYSAGPLISHYATSPYVYSSPLAHVRYGVPTPYYSVL
ncbi:calphotin-like [Leptidea sinapis]|uniref:calphotin-like n=1 Tax=Leptidea sinapis TaxID=189913 RepID=UPI0021C36869|nr:calphotin-like [Leptidea sinapis]